MIDASKVDNINAITGGGSSNAAQGRLNQTFEDFMVLLTTQLENQDPTQPLDTNQITQQIASMSQVQAQIDTNNKLDQLIAINNGSQLNNVVNYIGRVIEAEGNESMMVGDGENQAALFIYDLPAEAKSATISIYDENDVLVYSGQALPNAGRNEVVWDGFNSFTNQQMPLGAYNFTITARDYAGETLDATTYTTGVVTAVDTQDGNVSLSLGSIEVGLDNVTAIKTAQELL